MSSGRIGVVVPSPNTVLESDMIKLAPKGVTVHFARVGHEIRLSEVLLEAMSGELGDECSKLALAGVAALGYGCTSGSFFRTHGFDAKMVEVMKSASGGVPATTATTAAIAVMRDRGFHRISFCSPYEKDMHRKGVEYLAGQGFTVAGDACLGLMDERDITAVTVPELKSLVARADRREAEAVFISCTGLHAVGALPELSRHFGKPVLSSNQTLCEHLLQIANLEEN